MLKRILIALTLLLSAKAFATQWYVSPIHGGPRDSAAARAAGLLNTATCSGATPFNPSGGLAQSSPCADFRSLWDDPYSGAAAAWIVGANDTINVADCTSGSPCEIAGAPGTTSVGDFCFGLGPDCVPPALPDGVTMQGVNCISGCFVTDANWGGNGIAGNKPDPANIEYVYGAGNAAYAISMQNSVGFIIKGFDISDHAECGNTWIVGPQCDLNGATGMGIFAGNQPTSTNTGTIQDVNIHGFISRGVRGNCGGLWTWNRVEIANNGGGGLDFDPGSGQLSTNCDFEGSYVGIDGNGIVEQYPITTSTPWALNGLSDDGSGGYGDGVGTAISPAVRFACDHCRGNNNSQDAFDIGHWSGFSVSITNSTFSGNEGGTVKVGATTTSHYENNINGMNCQLLTAPYPGAPTGYNNHITDPCRAGEGSGYNVSTTSILYQSTPGGAYGITSSGTTITGNGLFLTGTLPPHVNDYVTTDSVCGQGSPTSSWIRQVTAITDETHLTINSAFPVDLTCGFEHLIKLAGASGSTSSAVITANNNVYMGYIGTILGNQCQTGYPQVGVDGEQCTGYAYNFNNNIVLGYGNTGCASNPNCSSGGQPTMWADLAATSQSHNNYFQLAGCSPCSGTGTITTSPLFNSQPVTPITAESQLFNYNFFLTGSSPGISSGTTPCPATDINGNAQTLPCTMGALVFGGSPPVTSTTNAVGISIQGVIIQ